MDRLPAAAWTRNAAADAVAAPFHPALQAECASLASSLPCRRLDWEDAGQEVDSGAADGAPAVVTAAANGQTAAGRGKRSRKA